MNTKKEEIMTYIADFKDVPLASVNKETPIKLNSLLFERFVAGLEKQVGIKLPTSELKRAETVGELLVLLDKTPKTSVSKEEELFSATNHVNNTKNISSGIDIEMVESFRGTVDVQGDSSFKRLFTPSEMAYCMLQEDPPQHFAARFCAKEAIRKCGRIFIDLPYHQIEICHKENGEPYVRILGEELKSVSISLSHTTEFAVASAILSHEPQSEANKNSQKTEATKPRNELHDSQETISSKSKLSKKNLLLSAISVLVIIEGAAIGLLWY